MWSLDITICQDCHATCHVLIQVADGQTHWPSELGRHSESLAFFSGFGLIRLPMASHGFPNQPNGPTSPTYAHNIYGSACSVVLLSTPACFERFERRARSLGALHVCNPSIPGLPTLGLPACRHCGWKIDPDSGR